MISWPILDSDIQAVFCLRSRARLRRSKQIYNQRNKWLTSYLLGNNCNVLGKGWRQVHLVDHPLMKLPYSTKFAANFYYFLPPRRNYFVRIPKRKSNLRQFSWFVYHNSCNWASGTSLCPWCRNRTRGKHNCFVKECQNHCLFLFYCSWSSIIIVVLVGFFFFLFAIV